MEETSNLESVLARLRGRMTRLVWTHGLSTVAGWTAALLLLGFLLDWGLHVPRGVRWFHLAALVALPAWLVLRTLYRPLRARPDRKGCAVLVERAHPELRELLVTAAELRAGGKDVHGRELAARVLADAERAASGLDLTRTLDGSGPRLRFLLGSLSTTLCVAVLVAGGSSTSIFFQRLFGGDASWPKRTRLAIEIPSAGTVLAEAGGPEGTLEVRVARGADVPVVVRAEGAIPDEVTLHLSGSQPAVIAHSGGGLFRTLLRSVQEDVSMYATGGDDLDEEPSVRLVVLRPPDVIGLALAIEPPPYSGLAPRTVAGGDVEILAGTKVVVHVLPDPADATGKVRILPEDRVVDLAPSPFPPPEAPAAGDGKAPVVDSAGAESAGAETAGLAFTLVPEKSLRYRIELIDASRLSNPDPGLFAITVVEDRPPEVEILAPGRGDYDTVPGGSLCLRARARDDFGIEAMSLSTAPFGSGNPANSANSASPASSDGSGAEPQALSIELPWAVVPREERAETDSRNESEPGREKAAEPRAEADAGRPAARAGSLRAARSFRSIARARARLDVATLAGAPDPAPGSQIEVVVVASDNHRPAAHESRSAALHVRVVSPDEYLRRLQDRLGRARTTAASLSELQRGKLRRTEELIAGLESDELLAADSGDEIFTAATGERRVEGDARSLARELCSALEGVLYARIDDRAGPLLEKIDARLAESDRTFDPAIWREASVEERAASGPPGGLADRLLAIAGVALEVSEVEAPKATAALARAQQTKDLARVHAELAAASEAEKAVVERIERLLEMLAEWDNYQSVLSLTHDILNGQKNLKERTKTFAKDH